jgi:hypothetical protein
LIGPASVQAFSRSLGADLEPKFGNAANRFGNELFVKLAQDLYNRIESGLISSKESVLRLSRRKPTFCENLVIPYARTILPIVFVVRAASSVASASFRFLAIILGLYRY